MLRIHEGLRLKPYLDEVGKLTIGFGRNLDDVGISAQEAEILFENDLLDARKRTEQLFPWFGILDAVRQDVIVMMVFNMGGGGVHNFTQMIEAIKRGDWNTAAEEMIDSVWARQVKDRAHVLSKMMKTGRYPAYATGDSDNTGDS